MSLEENIKKWVILDNKIKEINNQLKNIRLEKASHNTNILNYIASNNLDNVTIKINDGKLRFVDANYSQPLTFKFIYDCLNKYYNDVDKTIEIINFIKSQRDIKTIKEIKRVNL
jgi:hypothetical protein